MWLEKSPISVIIIGCLMVIYSLFYVKEEVLNIRMELAQVQKQVQREADSINILKAEFSYLTSPQRLAALNEKYIKLGETKLAQIQTDLLENKSEAPIRLAQNRIKKINWRYKKGPTEYITLVSAKKRR
ncbi:MAG: hypothetical protein DGJ47_000581 [Rickettsiaceae bacterium]